MKTKLFASIAAALVMSGSAVAEQTLPLKAVNKAGEVIDAVIEAYGGADKIANLNTIVRKNQFTTWATNQSLRPGPPWDEGGNENWVAINFADQQLRNYNMGSGGGFDFEGGQLINGDESFNFDYRAGTMTEIGSPDFNTTAGPSVRVTAPLLIKELQNRRHTSHWLGEVDFEGRKHDVVTLVMEVGPALSLYFDQETHLLTRSERVLPPFGQVDYRFLDYVEIDGIPFSRKLELFANDQPNLLIERHETQVNPDFAPYLEVPGGLDRIAAAPPAPSDVDLQEISDGVYLVGASGTYVMFVEMDDYVVAVGGTAGVPQRIAELRKVVPEKPIKYGVMTHHHNDHVMGVGPYENEGATVLTVKQHEPVVRAAAANGEELIVEIIDGSHWIKDGKRKLQLVDVGPTPHTEHLVVVWLPEEGILFEADHFPNPATGRMPPAQPVTRHLAKEIVKRNMKVKHIVGAHSPRVASWDDMEEALKLKPVNVRFATPKGQAEGSDTGR